MRVVSRNTAVATVVCALVLSGCAGGLPRERGYRQTGELLEARLGFAPAWPQEAATPQPSGPLSMEQAVRLAFLHNPAIRQAYARLGLRRADLEEARRLSNPGFGWSRLKTRGDAGVQITRSLSLGFSELLLLPARQRFATGELARTQQIVAAELLALATAVETAWLRCVSAHQVAAMRGVVAQAAEAGAELAQRFFDAGNIDRLALAREQAAAAEARIAAVRADATALRARAQLADRLGLSSHGDWQTPTTLPLPPPLAPDMAVERLLQAALEQRLDLIAARQRVQLQEDAWRFARRWRWLGEVRLGVEREREPDGAVARGPTLDLELPLFHQGQAGIERGQAALLDARARLDALLIQVQNEVRVAVDQLRTAHAVSERYRSALVPQREAIVARTQEKVNFMLIGVFELLQARQQEYDAWQEYLEAVRDVWIARTVLAQRVGGELPDAVPIDTLPLLGVEPTQPQSPAAEGHEHHQQRHPPRPATPPATPPQAPAHEQGPSHGAQPAPGHDHRHQPDGETP